MNVFSFEPVLSSSIDRITQEVYDVHIYQGADVITTPVI